MKKLIYAHVFIAFFIMMLDGALHQKRCSISAHSSIGDILAAAFWEASIPAGIIAYAIVQPEMYCP